MRICFDCFKKFEDHIDVCPHCGKLYNPEPIEPIHLQPGLVLNERFMLGHAVGAGGFGIVYRAWDFTLETVVAVKEFFVPRLLTRAVGRADVIVSNKAREEFVYRKERFLAEARTMAKFSANPNIPSVFEFFEANGTAYLVMELLQGMGLNDYLRQKDKSASVDFSIMVANEVGNALKALHAENIVHCDVAPDNVWLSQGATVRIKLLDLGAAKLTDSDNGVIDIILKPGYSPTEQYDSTKTIGPWTDIYALGATLYVMLTGVKPDESTNRKISDTLVPPCELNPEVSENLSNAILKSMAIDRHMRFKNVNEFLQAINGERKVVSLKAEKKKRRIKRLIGIALATAVMVICGIFVARYYKNKQVEAFLEPADITVWYCAEEDSDEHNAMEAMKADFEGRYEGITMALISYTPEEYEDKLREAAENDNLPTVFESTGVSADILSKAADLDKVMKSEQFSNALFLDQYDSHYENKKQMPIAIDIPVACVVTLGPVCLPYEDGNYYYFSSLEDLNYNGGFLLADEDGQVDYDHPTAKAPIAVSGAFEGLIRKNFGNEQFCDAAEFLEVGEGSSAVLLTSTREINDVKVALQGYSSSIIYYNAPEIHCEYTYEWSLGMGSDEEMAAGEMLLCWMLGNVYQDILMSSSNNEGYIPVDPENFPKKISLRVLKPIEDIYKKFVFD